MIDLYVLAEMAFFHPDTKWGLPVASHKVARQRICEALLRNCELDTLAMVMVVQAWQEMQQR